MSADLETIYWSSGASGSPIFRSPVDNPAVMLLTDASVNAVGLVTTSTTIYTATNGNNVIDSCGLPGPCVPTTFADTFPNPTGIAADSRAIYWVDVNVGVDGGARIESLALDAAPGTSPTTVASHQQLAEGIAADDAALYWTLRSGEVMKLVR